MNFIQSIRQRFSKSKSDNTRNSLANSTQSESGSIDDSQSRALVWLGKDKLERQYFYEKWASMEAWYVYSQGLPLLLGRDPDDPKLSDDEEFIEQQRELWQHIQRCVQRQVSPVLINPADSSENWQAEPVEVYRWAIAARLSVPEELDALLAFISATVKPSYLKNESNTVNNSIEEDASTKSIEREQVLSAMLALTLQQLYYESATDIDALRQNILDSIYSKSSVLFDQEQPPLSLPALHDLFDRSIEMAGLIR